jgi:hypothetical protein
MVYSGGMMLDQFRHNLSEIARLSQQLLDSTLSDDQREIIEIIHHNAANWIPRVLDEITAYMPTASFSEIIRIHACDFLSIVGLLRAACALALDDYLEPFTTEQLWLLHNIEPLAAGVEHMIRKNIPGADATTPGDR